MGRILDLIRTCTRLAWWDGSSIDLRLPHLGDLAFGREFGRDLLRVPARPGAPGDRA